MAANRVFLGIDIGGTNTKMALVNENGALSQLRRVMMADIDVTLEHYLEHVTNTLHSIVQACDTDIAGIGISSPGLQRKDGRGTLYSVNGVSVDSGRLILDVHSDDCDSSGIYGSAKALCGVQTIELLAREKCGALYHLTAHDIIQAAREYEETACDIRAVVARRLAHLMMNLSAIYFPDVISITGGQTESGTSFLVKCQEEFTRISRDLFSNYFSLNGKNKDIQIVKSEAGGLAGVVGSVVPLIQKTTS